jgi:hypothetical protein
MIRQQIEEGFDNIAEVDPEIRGIVARNWPQWRARRCSRALPHAILASLFSAAATEPRVG